MHAVQAENLTLEPQTAAHAEEMFVVLGDPAIYEYESEPPPSLDWLRARFTRLESRRSSDGREQWLNWVVRLATGQLIGYVQATVRSGGRAAIAYELASAYWGRGLAREAVQAMIRELADHHDVRSLRAVLKRENLRSMRLLERLGFSVASPEQHQHVDPGEWLMQRELIPPGIAEFWAGFCAHRGEDRSARFYEAFHFDDNEPSANALAELVLAGVKRATAGLVWSHESDGVGLPKPGSLSAVTRWNGEPVCVIETLSVEVLAFEQVSAEFAATEGEGDGSLAYWRRAHWASFGRECARIGREPSQRMPVACERFEVVYRPNP